MEEHKINAVKCSECGTSNPKFYIKCKKCDRKIDASDERVFDASIEKMDGAKWTATSLTIFVVVFGLLFFLAMKLFVFDNKSNSGQLNSNSSSNAYQVMTKAEFITKVKENQVVVDADITDVNFLYISVVNDGQSKDAMATFYCRLAKQNNVKEVKAVKIIDAATSYLPKNGTASGDEIGKSFCE